MHVTRTCSPDPSPDEVRRARRTRLLALAGAVDDLGMRARFVDYILRPAVLRCWDPDTMGPTLLVICERTGDAGHWEFRFQPGNRPFADADDATGPDRTGTAARAIAEALAAHRR